MRKSAFTYTLFTDKIGSGSSAVAKQPNGQVKKKVWSKEDQMASKIQTCYRGYRLAIIFHYIIAFSHLYCNQFI